jgi:hypothetical protein
MSLFTKLRRRLANFAGKVDKVDHEERSSYFPKGSSGEGKHGLGRLLQPLQAQLMLTTPKLAISTLETVRVPRRRGRPRRRPRELVADMAYDSRDFASG